MHKLRVFIVELILVSLLVSWIFWNYPEWVDEVIPWIVFAILWHLTIEIVLSRDDVKSRILESKARLGRMAWVVALLAAGCLSLVYLAAAKVVNSELPKKHTGTSATASVEAPTILVRYWQSSLPISVPARSAAYVLQLNPVITDGTFEVNNDRDTSLSWPEKERPSDQIPLGDMYECTLANLSDKALLNTSLVFDVRFYSIAKVEASSKSKNRKSSSLTVGSPSPDGESFAYYWKGRVVSGKTGDLVSRHDHRVVIPAIPAHSNATLYLVSQTNLFARFDFPKSATTVIDGFPTQRQAVLIRPGMNMIDRVPFWTLAPSIYIWPAIPDSGIDLTKPQKSGRADNPATRND